MARKVANETKRSAESVGCQKANTGVDAYLAANDEATKVFLDAMKSNIRKGWQVRKACRARGI